MADVENTRVTGIIQIMINFGMYNRSRDNTLIKLLINLFGEIPV